MANQKIGSLVIDLRARLEAFQSDMQKATSIMSKEMNNIGKQAALVAAPILAISGYAFKVANDYQKAMFTIRQGTGATGNDLKSMGDILRDVYAGSDENINDVATAIAGLNTRLGITGESLKKYTQDMLDFSQVAGMDVGSTVRLTTRLFGDWQISTDKQIESLNILWKTSQQTGITTSQMMETMTYYGVPLRQLGFSFEQVAVMLGKFEKEGVNADMIIAGLGRSMKNLTAGGLSASEGLANAIKKIREANENEAMKIGRELVGSRPGQAENFVGAIREGRMELDKLMEAVSKSGETFQKAREDTKTFGDRLREIKSAAEMALLPLGEKLLGMIEKDFIPKMWEASESVTGLVEAFSKAPEAVKQWGVNLGIAVSALAVGAPILGVWMKNSSWLLGAFAGLTGAMTAWGQAAVATLGSVGAAFTAVLAIPTAVYATFEAGKKVWNYFSDRAAKKEAEDNLAAITAWRKELDKWGNKGYNSGFNPFQNYGPKPNDKDMELINAGLEAQKKKIAQVSEEEQKYREKINDTVQSLLDKNRITKENIDVIEAARKAGASWADLEGYLGEKINLVTEYTNPAIKAIQALKREMFFDKADNDIAQALDDLMKGQFKIAEKFSRPDVALAEAIKKYGMPDPETIIPDALPERAYELVEDFHRYKMEIYDAVNAVKILTANGANLREVYEQYGRVLEEYPELLDAATTEALEMGKVQSIIRDGWINIGRTIETSFASAFSDIIAHANSLKDVFKNLWDSIKRSFTDMLGQMISAFLMKFINPMVRGMNGSASLIGSVMSGATGSVMAGGAAGTAASYAISPFGTPYMASGAGAAGGTTGILSSILGNLSFMGGIGGMSAGSSLLGGLFGGGSAGSILGGAAGGIGGLFGGAGIASLLSGGSIAGGAMAPLLTALMGPVGWVIGGGIGIAALINKLYKSTSDRAAQEASRDFGGVETSSKDFKSWASGLGLGESQFQGIRKDLLSSPKYLTEVAYQNAKQQGKVNEFLSSLSNVQTAWGTFDFRSAFETWMKTGSAAALNTAFEKAFAQSSALEIALPDWRDVLDASGESTGSNRVKVTRPNASGSTGATVTTPAVTSSPSASSVRDIIFNINTIDGQNMDSVVRDKVIPSLSNAFGLNVNNSRVIINKALGRA